MMRVDGQLAPLSGKDALGLEAAEKIFAEVMTDTQWAELARLGRLTFALEVPGVARCRVSLTREPTRLDAALRIHPWRPLSLEELGLPGALASLAELESGLVLFSGPIGCGKTTTLGAVLSLVAATRQAKIVTLEDPIELAPEPGRALVHPRQLGPSGESMAAGLRSALREDPDVIALGELDDRETLALALSAAEAGRLILGALPGGSVMRTLGHLITMFPELERPAIRRSLAHTLRAIVSQRLVMQPRGRGRAPAVELLRSNDRVADQIGKGELESLPITTFGVT
jgi:twitching motility protein PilT